MTNEWNRFDDGHTNESKRTLVLVVGKSSITRWLESKTFCRKYEQTVGCDFLSQTITIKGRKITIRLWDIGGQNLRSKMLATYVSSADAIFLVYDITDRSSFVDVKDWHAQIRRHRPKDRKQIVVLMGNKVDLDHQRKVPATLRLKYVDANEDIVDSVEVSARNGDRLLRTIYKAAADVCDMTVSTSEFDHLQNVVVAHIDNKSTFDEGRTAMADRIEAEDRAAMERARRRENEGGCCVLS